jgi:hypothetical protein
VSRSCSSARKSGCYPRKKPYARCRSEGCAQDQHRIGDPRRLRRSTCKGGFVDFIDLIGRSLRPIFNRGFGGAAAIGFRQSRPSRSRSRHDTGARAVDILISRYRASYGGSSPFVVLRDRSGDQLLHRRFTWLGFIGERLPRIPLPAPSPSWAAEPRVPVWPPY